MGWVGSGHTKWTHGQLGVGTRNVTETDSRTWRNVKKQKTEKGENARVGTVDTVHGEREYSSS